MFRLIGLSQDKRPEALRERVQTACAAGVEGEGALEGRGAATDRALLQSFHGGIERGDETRFKRLGALAADVNRFPDQKEGLGEPLVPEGVLDRKRNDGALAQAGGECGKARLEDKWPLAGVDELALGRDPENAAGAEDGLAGAEELHGAACGVQLDGEDA